MEFVKNQKTEKRKELLALLILGESERMGAIEEMLLKEYEVEKISLESIPDMRDRRVLVMIGADESGADLSYYQALRIIRSHPDCLEGSIGAVIVDGTSELYTKEIAQEIVLAMNLAGCLFFGRSLVEGTGSLYNQHIMAKNWGISLLETYHRRCRELAQTLMTYEPPHIARPKVLMLHASSNSRSNTVWMGQEVMNRLRSQCDLREVSLMNGTIYDCRGCSYEACLHYAENKGCFYGGPISEKAMPAIEESDVLLFLCPNYNDAVSANLMALMNRMTNLLLRKDLSNKYIYAIVVSGYSGGDIIARQLLGALTLNKTLILPPRFSLLQTAHDPDSAKSSEGIAQRLDRFSEAILKEVLP